jgi:membrane protein
MKALIRFAYRAGLALRRWAGRPGAVFWRAITKFDETDGEQRAASFAYYAFFALFPLTVLLITVFTKFLGNKSEAMPKITAAVSEFLPVEEASRLIIRTIDGVVKSRGRAGFIAFCVLAWSALRFFQALVRGVNRAWGTKEYSWWRLPIKNLAMTGILASALLLGILVPTALDWIEYFFDYFSKVAGLDSSFATAFATTLFYVVIKILRMLVPPLVLFYGFAMFYKFAPQRKTTFAEVWRAALFVTIGLNILKQGFVLYARHIGNFNALYGTLGSVVAILLWIYLSGSLIILGGCLCAARYEINMSLSDQSERNRAG